MPQINTVVTDHCFTEGPRWHEGRLWFSDFYLGRVSSVRSDGSDFRVEAVVENQPSGLGWLPDGRLLIVSMRDQLVLRREDDGTLVEHADLSGHVRGHANDMLVDAEGRAYVGCFGFDLMGGAPIELAPLVRVDPDGTVSVVAEDLWFPNGMALTDDGVLLVNETVGNRISAFDVADDGSLSNHRVWAEFAPTPTEREFEKALAQVVLAPDGGTLDSDGGWWVADAVNGRLVRVVDGQIEQEIQPGTGVFACTVGGDHGRTLFACCAPDFFEHARREATEASIVAFDLGASAR